MKLYVLVCTDCGSTNKSTILGVFSSFTEVLRQYALAKEEHHEYKILETELDIPCARELILISLT